MFQVRGTIEQEGVRLRINHYVVQRLDLVCDFVAESVVDGGIDNVPATARQRVDDALRFLFGLELRVHRRVGITVRVEFLVWFRQGRIDFIDRVGGAINARVHTNAEKVLMNCCGNLWCNGSTIFGIGFTRAGDFCGQNAGKAHFVLNCAVEVHLPVESIVVVRYGCKERSHQSTGTSHFSLARAPI